jgi:predicted CopG family antitoxin
MNQRNRRIISLSEENYRQLKEFGTAGDSFNRVITEILKKIKPQQTEIGVGTP